eukprot:4681417-Karenia_brevis.AAC.1
MRKSTIANLGCTGVPEQLLGVANDVLVEKALDLYIDTAHEIASDIEKKTDAEVEFANKKGKGFTSG